jgi:hypothetical protein
MSGWSVATWAPVAAGWPLVGAAIGAGSAAALTRKLRQVPASEAWRIAGLGNLYAGRLLAGTLTRAWWPIALPAALLSRRARRVVIAAAVVPDRRSTCAANGRRSIRSATPCCTCSTTCRTGPACGSGRGVTARSARCDHGSSRGRRAIGAVPPVEARVQAFVSSRARAAR